MGGEGSATYYKRVICHGIRWRGITIRFFALFGLICTSVDQNLIADQRNFRAE